MTQLQRLDNRRARKGAGERRRFVHLVTETDVFSWGPSVRSVRTNHVQGSSLRVATTRSSCLVAHRKYAAGRVPHTLHVAKAAAFGKKKITLSII